MEGAVWILFIAVGFSPPVSCVWEKEVDPDTFGTFGSCSCTCCNSSSAETAHPL